MASFSERPGGCAVFAVVAALLGVFPGSTATRAETLEEALIATYRDNPMLLAERSALRATDEEVSAAAAGWRPTVLIDASAGVQQVTSESSAGFGADSTLYPKTATISIVQPLYQGGRTLAETERAENLVLSGRARLASVEQDILLNAAEAYMDVVRDGAVLGLAVNNEQRLRRQLEAARDRFQVGEVTRTDVAQAEARLSVAIADRVGAEGDLVSSRATYRRVIGHLPGALEGPGSVAGLPQSVDEAQRIAEEEHPLIRRAIHAERAAREDIAVAMSSLLPDLSLRGSYAHSEETSTFIDRQDTASLRAEIVIPLYQSGAEYAGVRAAKQIASQRRLEIDRSRRLVLEQVTQAWHSLQTARARIVALSDAVRAAEIALDGVEQEAAVGSRTTLDVLDAEQELFDARVDLVRARREEIVAGYGLLAAVGRLSAGHLGLDVAIYDEKRHYDAVRSKMFGLGVDDEDDEED
jgi:TolC family type I secretion outer membrane protein